MIETLNIKNFALIKDIKVEFSSGLNILSGETGAGKSIIIDALCFLLGGRSDKSLVRNGQLMCKVDGIFNVEKSQTNLEIFEKIGLEFDSQVLISRTLTFDGRSDSKINGQIVTVSMLKEFASNLVDIYGQHEHQQILKEKFQLLLLDNYFKAGIEPLKIEFNENYQKFLDIANQLKTFGGSDEERLRQIDLLKYQIEEIENSHIQQNEDENLQLERKKLLNIEKIILSVNETLDNLDCINAMQSAVKSLNSASKFDESLIEFYEKLNSVYYDIDDVSSELKNYVKNSYFDKNKLEEIEQRIDQINNLKRKYGNSIVQIFDFLINAKTQLNKLEQSTEHIIELENKKNIVLKKLFMLNEKLSETRRSTAKKLEMLLIEQLENLGMNKVQIKFNFNNLPNEKEFINAIKQNGTDSVEILFSANFGEELKPLNKIISGGEMSRFMLALKAITADSYEISTMIFDEIDTGISGKTAHSVSEVVSKISKNHQVIAISHLFQIVAMADSHFYVSKATNEKETYTSIINLNRNQQIEDIARMISGNEITSISMTHAKELKDWCDNFKREN